jgi:hypothetical protein
MSAPDTPMEAFPIPRSSEPGVFVDCYQIENAGHVVQLWSDADRRSWGICSCGWDDSRLGAGAMLNAWRAHVDEVRLP